MVENTKMESVSSDVESYGSLKSNDIASLKAQRKEHRSQCEIQINEGWQGLLDNVNGDCDRAEGMQRLTMAMCGFLHRDHFMGSDTTADYQYRPKPIEVMPKRKFTQVNTTTTVFDTFQPKRSSAQKADTFSFSDLVHQPGENMAQRGITAVDWQLADGEDLTKYFPGASGTLGMVCDNCSCPGHDQSDCKYPKHVYYCCFCTERIAITVMFYQRNWDKLGPNKMEYPWNKAEAAYNVAKSIPGINALFEKANRCQMYYCEYSPLRANDRKHYLPNEPRVKCHAMAEPIDHFNQFGQPWRYRQAYKNQFANEKQVQAWNWNMVMSRDEHGQVHPSTGMYQNNKKLDTLFGLICEYRLATHMQHHPSAHERISPGQQKDHTNPFTFDEIRLLFSYEWNLKNIDSPQNPNFKEQMPEVWSVDMADMGTEGNPQLKQQFAKWSNNILNPFHQFIMQKRMCVKDKATGKLHDWNPISRLNRCIDQAKIYTCELCEGWGHAAPECGTKANLDLEAQRIGVQWEWGQYKYFAWYRRWLAIYGDKGAKKGHLQRTETHPQGMSKFTQQSVLKAAGQAEADLPIEQISDLSHGPQYEAVQSTQHVKARRHYYRTNPLPGPYESSEIETMRQFRELLHPIQRGIQGLTGQNPPMYQFPKFKGGQVKST